MNEKGTYIFQWNLTQLKFAKQLHKVDNKLVDFSANSTNFTRKSLQSEENIFSIESQISITKLLINTLTNDNYELLPANMVIENNEINKLISEYNEMAKPKKISFSALALITLQRNNLKIQFVISAQILLLIKKSFYPIKYYNKKLSNQFYEYDIDVSNFQNPILYIYWLLFSFLYLQNQYYIFTGLLFHLPQYI